MDKDLEYCYQFINFHVLCSATIFVDMNSTNNSYINFSSETLSKTKDKRSSAILNLENNQVGKFTPEITTFLVHPPIHLLIV